VEVVRHFNRTYTPRIGVLDDSFLGSGLPVGGARLLFEIGLVPAGVTIRDLRRRLGLDSGYTSRLLRRLEGAGLVAIVTDPVDARRRVCRLTAKGKRHWAKLDQRSDEVAARLLAPLSPAQQARLTELLDTADRLLQAAGAGFDVVDPTSEPANAAMRAYFAELDERFAGGFDPGDALGEGARPMSPPSGAFLVAVVDGFDGAAACGGLQRHDHRTAEIKRMWVAAAWRGTGLGRRMLAELEAHAASLGYRRVVLDTNGTLDEAIALYASSGYEPVERYNDNPYAQRWFAKRLQ
jgi:DNA-binding MarR family transcriptional regulator/GNAT superfamily N-acetyltransferase